MCGSIVTVICLLVSVGCVANSEGARGSQAQDHQVDQLRGIGLRVSKAVVERDVETILSYDRPDLREADRLMLQRKADLYCYLFDSTCTLPNRLSVRDVLVNAKALRIEVQILDASNVPMHGLLLFFDQAVVTMQELSSPSYLCELSRRNQIASWLFKYEKGAWVSANPPFDLETDTLCSARM
jgi:hypothetical protein